MFGVQTSFAVCQNFFITKICGCKVCPVWHTWSAKQTELFCVILVSVGIK
jgi:hypothetical protein